MTKEEMVRWSGYCWMAAGLLVAVATLVHPSSETAQSILAEEFRLITAHWLFTFFCAFFMLGLPGVYAVHAERFGRAGLISFLMLFFGTLFFAVSDDYGFVAPVLARMAPQTLDAVNAYLPNAVMAALFTLLMLSGFILLVVVLRRLGSRLGWSGLLMAVGFVLFLAGGALSHLVFAPLWALTIVGAILWGLGLALAGYRFGVEKVGKQTNENQHVLA